MKRLWGFALLFAALAAFTSLYIVGSGSNVSATPKTVSQIVLISVDGFRPEFYLDAKYNTPTMKALSDAGAHATSSVPIFPTVTYPNHTTLITGVYANKHGILSNSLFSWESGPSPAWFWEASHIQVPTLHDIAKSAGLKTASLRWPVTLQASNITFLIPEIFGMTGFYEGNDFDLTVKYTDKTLMDDVLKNTKLKRYDDEVQTDSWVAEATAHILKSRSPSLTTIHLANVDHVEHGFGREGAEVEAAVQDADNNIKTIVNAIDLKNTCVIITGDHGFFDISQKISPNLLFAQKGWITQKDGVTDWKVMAHASGGQAAIYFKDKSLIPAATQLLKDNESAGFTVIPKAKLVQLGAYPGADLAIEGKPGFAISSGLTGTLVSSSGSLKGQHGYLPEHPQIQTGFIASGCGIPARKNLGQIRAIDVAPTIADLLGLHGSFDGQPLALGR